MLPSGDYCTHQGHDQVKLSLTAWRNAGPLDYCTHQDHRQVKLVLTAWRNAGP